MTRVRELVEEGRRRLAGRVAESAGREAARLLAHLLGTREVGLLARDGEAVDETTASRFLDLVGRRAAGEPAAYLTGEREFFGRRFAVDRRVLVPRPETEHLVEIALTLPLPERASVLDVGTGSGAIALTLAAERPAWRVVASDRSLGALALARSNAHALTAGVALVAADLDSGLELSGFDLVVSNPPYVDPQDESALTPEVRAHEPSLALFAEGGLAVIERLLTAGRALRSGAHLALEIGAGQAAAVVERARDEGLYDEVRVSPDLAGIERDVVLRRGAHGG